MSNPETNQPKKSADQWIITAMIAAGAAIALCACVVIVLAAAFVFGFSPMSFLVGGSGSAPAIPVAPISTLPSPPVPGEVSPEPVPEIPDTGIAPDAPESLASELPPRDRYDLARRFLGIGDAEPPEPVVYEVGDVTSFWVDNDDLETVVEVFAELAYVNEHVYMWVQQGLSYNYDALVSSADRFSEETYPTNHSFFGSEASPGIDGDPRLHILHSDELGSWVAGYFYSPSEYPASVVPYSNEKEIFFINIGNTPPGSDYYDGVLAHEFQHMIHWVTDQNEESWLNEGMSELAAYLNGFGPSEFTPYFLSDPDLQLTSWPDGGGAGANYGAGYLFVMYFLERFGQDDLRTLVAHTQNGMEGVDATLDEIGESVTADDVFADWVVANLLNDPDVAPGIYGYPSLSGYPTATVYETHFSYPVERADQTVNQFGADYIELEGSGAVTVRFDGSDLVRIIPADTFNTDGDPDTDDSFVWWSNRGDDSDMMLTRSVDLSGVDEATLAYDAWFWIEDLWDYAYVTVSEDGGETWMILETPYTTTEDPHGNIYGPAYTGQSAYMTGASDDGWVHESIDLSAYAGQEILLRFEMVTDDAVNQPGLAIDNICIDAIGWCDDVEAGAEGWEAQGFVRHHNVLPQRFVVQAIVPASDGDVDVQRLELDENNQGEWTFEVGRGPVTLVISGLTRYTTEPAWYSYSITPAD